MRDGTQSTMLSSPTRHVADPLPFAVSCIFAMGFDTLAQIALVHESNEWSDSEEMRKTMAEVVR